jgi:hypothetical protein
MSKPDFRVYSVIKREGKDDFWLNLGVAFKHEDGQGYNLLLQAQPLDGKLVMRTYREEDEAREGDEAREDDRRGKRTFNKSGRN